MAASACGGGRDIESVATPIAAGSDFSFEDLLTTEPSTSPSAAPSAAPAARSASTSGTGSKATAKPAPTSAGRVACPSGKVTGEIASFDASEDNRRAPNPDGTRRWSVRASGLVHNQTSRPVRDIRVEIEVRVDNADDDSDTVVLGQWVGSGSSTNWSAEFGYDSEDEPKKKNATLFIDGWSWGDSQYDHCGMTRWSG